MFERYKVRYVFTQTVLCCKVPLYLILNCFGFVGDCEENKCIGRDLKKCWKGWWPFLYGSWPKSVHLFSALKYISAERPYQMQHFPARIFMGKLKIILMYFPIWIFFIIPKFQILKLINFFLPHFPIKRLNKSCFKCIQKSDSEGLLDEHRWTRF